MRVEGKGGEVDLELHPPPVDAERLEEDEEHEDEAEDAGLQPGLLHEAVGETEHGGARVRPQYGHHGADPRGHGVASLGDQHGEEGHEPRPEQGAVQAAEAAHHHHEQELDGEEHAEDVRSEIADLVREEGAGEAHEGGRVREGHGLVGGEVHAHGLRGDLAVPDGHPRPAGGRAQQVASDPEPAHQDGEAEKVKGDLMGEGDPEDHRLVDGPALEPVRHPVPPREHFLDDEGEGEGGNGEIDAGHAKGGQADEHAGSGGEHGGQGDGEEPRESEILGEVHVGVRADPEERRVTQADEPGVAREHHEGEAAQSVDQHEADVHEIGGDELRQHEQTHEQGNVPVPLRAVGEEGEVLAIGRLEGEAHTRDARPSFARPPRRSPEAGPRARRGARGRRRRP